MPFQDTALSENLDTEEEPLVLENFLSPPAKR